MDDPLVLVRITQAFAYNMTYTEPEEDKPDA